MIRKLVFLLIIVVLGFIGYLGDSIYNNWQTRKAVEKRIASLPAFSASCLNGEMKTVGQVPLNRPIVITYFQTWCPFCQDEIQSMANNKKLQKQAAIYLISDQPMDSLVRFRRSFKLDSLQNIHVWRDRNHKVRKLFGIRGIPSTFVYGTDGRLLESYEGETKADVFYQLLKRVSRNP
jgi:peroxiredoxin